MQGSVLKREREEVKKEMTVFGGILFCELSNRVVFCSMNEEKNGKIIQNTNQDRPDMRTE